MSAGPPFGHPWPVNVGNNPNINRDPPPLPVGAPIPQAPPAPAPAPAAAAAGPAQVVVEQQYHNPIYGPPLPIGIAPPFSIDIGAFPPVFPPLGIMDPLFVGGAGFMPPPPGGGPLAPIRTGNFLPNAQYGIGFGLNVQGVPFPPPPPGAVPGVLPPFAPAAPLWTAAGAAGLAFGNVPAAAGGVVAPVPMVMNAMGAASQHQRPAPLFHDGNHGHHAQPAQADVSQIAGGIPAGVMLVESAEHTIFIRITGNVCPWLSPGASFAVEQLAAASTTGLNRLIQICNDGIPEDELEGTAVTECIELGNGLWEKGQTFRYNDAVSKVLTMKDAGWDNTRNRVGGNSLHLWGHRV